MMVMNIIPRSHCAVTSGENSSEMMAGDAGAEGRGEGGLSSERSGDGIGGDRFG